MFSSTIPDLTSLLTTYADFAVFACIAIESTGIPFPGETMLLAVAIYAGTTHQLSLPPVIAAAVPLKTNTKKDEVMWSKSYQQDRHIWGSHRMHAEITLQCGHRSAKSKDVALRS